MKRLLIGFCILMSVSAVMAQSVNSGSYTRAQKDLETKQRDLIKNLPAELQSAYKTEINNIINALETKKWDEEKRFTPTQLKTALSSYYAAYEALKSDKTNYLKSKTSAYIITDAEKTRVKNEMLMYQKPIADIIESWMKKAVSNMKSEGKFTVVVRNTVVDINFQVPKITSISNFDQGRSSVNMDWNFTAILRGEKSATIQGTVSLDLIMDESFMYVRVPTFNVEVTGDEETKVFVETMVHQAQETLNSLGNNYLKVSLGDVQGLSTATSLNIMKNFIDMLRTVPAVLPYKRINANSFVVVENPEFMKNANGFDNDLNLGVESGLSTPVIMELNGERSRLGICPSEGLGTGTTKECGYLKRTLDVITIKAHTESEGEVVDLMMNNFGKDVHLKVTSKRENMKLDWSSSYLSASYEGNDQNITVLGPLSLNNANLTIGSDGAKIGSIWWDQTIDQGSFSINLQLWDENKTYFSIDGSAKNTFGTFPIEIPKNTVTPESLSGFEDVDVSPSYTDLGNESTNASGTMDKKEMREVMARAHNKTINEKSDIALIVFTDLECLPFCATFHNETLTTLENNGTSFDLYIRHLPLDYHPNGKKWATEAECVAKNLGEDSFFEYLADKFSDETKDPSSLKKLTTAQKNTCSKNASVKSRLKNDARLAQKYDVGGTPSIIILNKKTGYYEVVVGAQPVEAFLSAISRVK